MAGRRVRFLGIGIDRLIGDQIAMRNAIPGFKLTRHPQGALWGRGRKCLAIRRKPIAS